MNTADNHDSVSALMYYDDYEYMYGDGFYPQMEKSNENTSILISFNIIKISEKEYWHQSSVPSIRGLDGNTCGSKLLDYLNKNGNIRCEFICNYYSKIIYIFQLPVDNGTCCS
jgi:hypothetical protein